MNQSHQMGVSAVISIPLKYIVRSTKVSVLFAAFGRRRLLQRLEGGEYEGRGEGGEEGGGGSSREALGPPMLPPLRCGVDTAALWPRAAPAQTWGVRRRRALLLAAAAALQGLLILISAESVALQGACKGLLDITRESGPLKSKGSRNFPRALTGS